MDLEKQLDKACEKLVHYEKEIYGIRSTKEQWKEWCIEDDE